MSRKKVYCLFLILAAFMASCVTHPTQELLDELAQAMARAASARERALNVQGQVYFPEEWEAAESNNEAGKRADKTTVDGVKQGISSFIAAAGGYDAIAEKSGPLYTQDMENFRAALEEARARAEKSRSRAEENQGSAYFPDDWKAAEADYNNGENAEKDTLEQVKTAAALFNTAADKYDDIATKSAPLYAAEKDTAQKALQEAMARADKSRKDAQGVQAQTYFANEWKNAEDKTAAGKNAKKTTTGEIKAATALYVSAADIYDDITVKSRPLQAKDEAQKVLNAAMARAEKSRQQAQAANGQANFPNEWKAAEDKNTAGNNAKKTTADEIKAAAALYTSAADGYDDITKKSAALNKEKDDAQKALNTAIARLEKSRQQAVAANGQTNLPNEWRDAESKNQAAQNAKRATAAEIKAAVPLYNTAADAYDDIVKNGGSRAAEEAKSKAEKERQAAVDVKADVAVKDDFGKADALFQQALKDFGAKSFAAAADKYNQSAAQFSAAAQAAGGKRVLAENTIGTAKQKSDESTAYAVNSGITAEENQ